MRLMKATITGLPKSGKSTLLEEALSSVENKNGFLTKQTLHNGQRTGFCIEPSDQRKFLLASKAQILSSNKVGSYWVDVDAFDNYIEHLRIVADSLFYLDEVGEMQLLSTSFNRIFQKILDTHDDLIFTMTSIFQNQLTENIIGRKDLYKFTLNTQNRSEILNSVITCMSQNELFNKLTTVQKNIAYSLGQGFIDQNNFVSFNKIFNNSLKYVLDNKATEVDKTKFNVYGFSNVHQVTFLLGSYKCDCPLFMGSLPYLEPGECSHIVSVKLMRA